MALSWIDAQGLWTDYAAHLKDIGQGYNAGSKAQASFLQLVDFIMKDSTITTIAVAAYFLATVKRETGHRFAPISEDESLWKKKDDGDEWAATTKDELAALGYGTERTLVRLSAGVAGYDAGTWYRAGELLVQLEAKKSPDDDTKALIAELKEVKSSKGAMPAAKAGNKVVEVKKSRFYGRGYIQLTHHDNYKIASTSEGHADRRFCAYPEEVLPAEISYKLSALYITSHTFKATSVADHLPDELGTRAQFENARKPINGSDAKEEIAGFALDFQGWLNDQKTAVDARPEVTSRLSIFDNAITPAFLPNRCYVRQQGMESPFAADSIRLWRTR